MIRPPTNPIGFALLVLAGCGGGPEPADPDDPAAFRFVWATVFDEDTLAEHVARDQERYREEPRRTVLEDAAFRIEQAYRLEGYYRVSVMVDAFADRPTFLIEEGPQFGLGRVHFVGNRFITDEELKQLTPDELPGTTLPFSERLVARLRADVARLYDSRGFIEVEIGEPAARVEEEEEQVNVTISITEGRNYQVEKFEGLAADKELGKRLEAFLGQAYTSGTVRRVEAALLDHYRERGRPFVRARVEPWLDWRYGQAILRINLDPGKEARISGFEVEGNERTRDSFVLQRSGLGRKEPYRSSDLRSAEKRLQETGLFRTARVEAGEFDEEKDPKDGNLKLKLTLEEVDPGEVSVSAGYSTLDGLRVGADAKYMNLFGGAELLRVGGTVSQFGWRADADAKMRFFMGWDLTPGVGGFYEDRDEPSFEAVTFGGRFSLTYHILNSLDLTGGLRYAEVKTGDVDAGVPAGDVLDFEYAALFLSARLNMRDNPFLPTEGFYLLGNVEWTDEPLHTDIEFFNLSGQGAVYLPLPFGIVWATGAQGGRILPIADTVTIPVSLRNFAGGTGTVRGFDFRALGPGGPDDPTGGEVFLALQTELRYPIWGLLHGAVFHDRGGVWFRHDDVDLDEARWSVGTGLRIYTPAGALTADAAWNPSKEDDEDAVVFHFSIGFPF